jgi:hypothetical protein
VEKVSTRTWKKLDSLGLFDFINRLLLNTDLYLIFELGQWEDEFSRSGGFDRGSGHWWRQQHYSQEFVGSNGVQSMDAVQVALKTLEVCLPTVP